MNTPAYPMTPTMDEVDAYHGVQVPDPYRWLESDTGFERSGWIAAQNAFTEDYLSKLPERDELRHRFEQLLAYPRYYDFRRQRQHLLYTKNNGLESQLALYCLDGPTGPPRILVDPLALAPDGTTRLTTFALSHDACYLAYGLSKGGSDWQEFRLKDMRTGQDLGDRVRWIKGPVAAWRGAGFYYSRYPTPLCGPSARNEHHQVWYHQVGTSQLADALVYADPGHPDRLHFVTTT